MEPRGPDTHLGEILFIVNIFFQLGTDAKITIQFVCLYKKDLNAYNMFVCNLFDSSFSE